MNGLKIGGKALIWRSLIPENINKVVTITGFAGAEEVVSYAGGVISHNAKPVAFTKEITYRMIQSRTKGMIKFEANYADVANLIPLWEEDEDEKIEEEAEA